jgi:CubicO group peptidase (beta-lactamase class C family)
MLLDKTLVGSLLGFAATSAARIVATDEVPLIGPTFLTNFDPSNSTAIQNAKSKFPGLIDNLFSTGALNRTDLAFSIDVFSAATNSSIYSYSHVGEDSKDSVTSGVLDDKTISRIGSVTKLFTVYAIIAKAGIQVFSDPVTKYLPELAGNSSNNPLERIRWEDITVGALSSQQAGSGGVGGMYSCDLLECEADSHQTIWRNLPTQRTRTTTSPKVSRKNLINGKSLIVILLRLASLLPR